MGREAMSWMNEKLSDAVVEVVDAVDGVEEVAEIGVRVEGLATSEDVVDVLDEDEALTYGARVEVHVPPCKRGYTDAHVVSYR
jgi:hypothetical protein